MAAVIAKNLTDAIRRGRYLQTISLPDVGTAPAGTGWGYKGVGNTSYNWNYPSTNMEEPAISGVNGMMIGSESDISEVEVHMVDPTDGSSELIDLLGVNRPLLYQLRSNYEALASGVGLKRIMFSAVQSYYLDSYIRCDNTTAQTIVLGADNVFVPQLDVTLFLLDTPNQVPLKRSPKIWDISPQVSATDQPVAIIPCMGRKKITGFADARDPSQKIPGTVADCRITVLHRCVKGATVHSEQMVEEQIWPVGGGAVRIDGHANNVTGPRITTFANDIPEGALFVVVYNKGTADLHWTHFGITLED